MQQHIVQNEILKDDRQLECLIELEKMFGKQIDTLKELKHFSAGQLEKEEKMEVELTCVKFQLQETQKEFTCTKDSTSFQNAQLKEVVARITAEGEQRKEKLLEMEKLEEKKSQRILELKNQVVLLQNSLEETITKVKNLEKEVASAQRELKEHKFYYECREKDHKQERDMLVRQLERGKSQLDKFENQRDQLTVEIESLKKLQVEELSCKVEAEKQKDSFFDAMEKEYKLEMDSITNQLELFKSQLDSAEKIRDELIVEIESIRFTSTEKNNRLIQLIEISKGEFDRIRNQELHNRRFLIDKLKDDHSNEVRKLREEFEREKIRSTKEYEYEVQKLRVELLRAGEKISSLENRDYLQTSNGKQNLIDDLDDINGVQTGYDPNLTFDEVHIIPERQEAVATNDRKIVVVKRLSQRKVHSNLEQTVKEGNKYLGSGVVNSNINEEHNLRIRKFIFVDKVTHSPYKINTPIFSPAHFNSQFMGSPVASQVHLSPRPAKRKYLGKDSSLLKSRKKIKF